MPLTAKYKISLLLTFFFLSGIFFYALTDTAIAARKKFKSRDCLDCHQKFEEKYMNMKNVHPILKKDRCEDCHMRHGIIPKLIMKKEGNDLCLTCHDKKK